MSTLSERDNLNPSEPSHYAPHWLREKSEMPPSPARETRSEIARGNFPPASLDTQLENAVSDALWHSLAPEVIHEPPGYASEVDRRRALISVASRFAAAVAVSAIVALFFVIMIPASRDRAPQPDGAASPSSGIWQSIRNALYRSAQSEDDSKPALSEFQKILTSSPTGQPNIAPEQSEALFQQFVRWREKPNSTAAPQ